MNAATPPGASSRTALVARLARTYLTPRWKTLAAAALCAGVFAALSGALLAILQPAVNDLVIHPKPGALTRIPLMIVALALARALTQVLEARLVNRLGAAVVGQVQRDLFAGLIGADLARLRDSHTGVFVSQVLYDSGLIREAATRGLLNFLRQSLILLAAAWVMLTADWRLFLAVAAAGPLTLAVLRRYSRRGVKAAEGAMETSASLSRTILESLAGARVVKMEGREAFETRRVGAVIAERQGHIVRGDNARATAGPATEAVMTVVIAAVLAYAGWRAGIGGRAPGALLAFFAALIMAGQAVRQIANAVTAMTQGLAAAARLFAALDVKPAIGDRPGARRLEAGEGLVRLETVSFAYGDGPTVLDDISIEARRGEVVALVGPSGAGKSTALNLIPRFYDVAGGRLTIDGVDVRDVTLASLRAQIALVTQEPFLFDDSIAANIAYARPGASTAEIEAAAEAAAAHAFIEALPRGYDSPVGEAGMRLSGGERQRIAIARAFLKDAPILLLDEATSALDAESEALVRAALARLMAGRTTLVIAHRLSTVQNADRIYVLDRGRVVETGTHGALIAQRGLYARLARSQHLEPAAEAAE